MSYERYIEFLSVDLLFLSSSQLAHIFCTICSLYGLLTRNTAKYTMTQPNRYAEKRARHAIDTTSIPTYTMLSSSRIRSRHCQLNGGGCRSIAFSSVHNFFNHFCFRIRIYLLYINIHGEIPRRLRHNYG